MTEISFTELKEIQSNFAKIQNLLDNKLRLFESSFEKLFKEKINHLQQKFKIAINYIVSLRNGSHSDEWTPKIYIYHISKNSITWYWNSKFEWFTSGSGYSNTILTIKKIPLPISNENLQFIFNELSNFEIPYELVNTPVKETPDRIKCFDDIKLLLGEDTKLIDEGKIWYVGWDIEDIWFIVENSGKYHVFYSSDSHGFGCEHIKPKNTEKLNEFFNFMENNKLNNYIATKEKYESIILDSWKFESESQQDSE